MKIATFTRCAASALLSAALLVPAFGQVRATQSSAIDVPYSAVVETIEFKDVTAAQQKLVLERIGVRVGDKLDVEARHRIGRELGKVQKGLVFSYKAGSRSGTATLIISSDC